MEQNRPSHAPQAMPKRRQSIEAKSAGTVSAITEPELVANQADGQTAPDQ
jgi:hypothetical protein